jgi:hypothetical protein
VIGEALYELKFRVEMNVEVNNPQPMEMDDNQEGNGSGHRRDNVSDHNEKQESLGPKASSSGSSNDVKKANSRSGKQAAQAAPVFLIQTTPFLEQEGGGKGAQLAPGAGLGSQGAGSPGGVPTEHPNQAENVFCQEEGKVEEVFLDEDSSQADSMDTKELEMALKEWGDDEESSKPPSAEELAAIPEASPEQSVARRSKRRVGEADEEVGAAAERRKAFRNEGNLVESNPSFSAQDSMFISNLNTIGISLGIDDATVSESMFKIRENALGRSQEGEVASLKDMVLEKEDKELLEEEELEKLFLKNICSDIMDEVMDHGSDYDVVLPEGYNSKRGNKRGKNLKINIKSCK